MQHTTLDSIVSTLKAYGRDAQVVLMPGNDRCQIWPLGHPHGYAETHPKAITVHGYMNGHTKDFLRVQLNKIDGWAITGNRPRPDPEDAMDFAVQEKLDLDIGPQESKRHKIWAMVKKHGPGTSRELGEHMGDTDRARMSMMLQKYYVMGDLEREPKGNAFVYRAAIEPPYEPQSAWQEYGTGYSGKQAMREIVTFLKQFGPQPRIKIQEATGHTKRKTTVCLIKLKQAGMVTHNKDEMPYRPLWSAVK